RLILNDAYNANPTSMASALRTAIEMAAGRPVWAVLGPMAELGSVSAQAHRRIGRLAAALPFQRVVVVGDAAPLADAAGAERVGDADAAAALVLREAPPDAVVLVKGSRSAGL